MGHSIYLAGLALVAVAGQAVTEDTPVDRSIDAVLNVYGLDGLSEEQRSNARRLVMNLLRSQNGDAEAGKAATRYLEREGYRLMHMEMVRVEGATYLVVRDGSRRSSTKDLPFGLNSFGFRAGPHFAKRQIMGGVSELIDDEGEVHRLLFANWIELK